MRLHFFNRTREIARLTRALKSSEPAFIAVYGRRRYGKSTLLQHIASDKDIYYLTDQQETPLQIKSLADEVGRHIVGFEQASYSPWPYRRLCKQDVGNCRQNGETCQQPDSAAG